MTTTTVTPTNPTQWAEALNTETASADVDLASEEIHSLHGLGIHLLSADGSWIAKWDPQQGWTAEEYERPAVRVAIDMENDCRVAGVPTHPAILAEQTAAWRQAAQEAAAGLLVDLTIVEALYGSPQAAACDPVEDEDGNLTLAGRIWQDAHDASGPGVGEEWMTADLMWDGQDWELVVHRHRWFHPTEVVQVIGSGQRAVLPEAGTEVVLTYLVRQAGYVPSSGPGPEGTWYHTEEPGVYGMLVVCP